jgi:hypothetical protein
MLGDRNGLVPHPHHQQEPATTRNIHVQASLTTQRFTRQRYVKAETTSTDIPGASHLTLRALISSTKLFHIRILAGV